MEPTGAASVLIRDSFSAVTAKNGNQLGVDPEFVNPSIQPTSANFHLRPTSPAIGRGTSAFGVPTFDLGRECPDPQATLISVRMRVFSLALCLKMRS